MVSFADDLDRSKVPHVIPVPIRRCSSISKELAGASILRDSSLTGGGRPVSFADSIRSPSSNLYSYSSFGPSYAFNAQPTVESLPLERLRPRSKSAHQSNQWRQSKQLQKIPEVIQALRAPQANRDQTSEPSTTDDLRRSRLLRCNFLLKPDAAGYEYARRVQLVSHATYTHLNNGNDRESHRVSMTGKRDTLVAPFQTYLWKFHKKIYEIHRIEDQQVDQFTTDDG